MLENTSQQERTWKFSSAQTHRQAVGLVEGMGYKVRYKHLGALTTYAANHLVRI